jgi:hypothetical protein
MAGLLAALVLGGILGAMGERLASDSGPMRATETGVLTQETLATVPSQPLVASAETIRLPAGFLDTRTQDDGPVFNRVESGQVEVTQDGRARLFDAGDFFIEPYREETTIRALETTILAVIRLVPADAESE